MHPNAFNVQIEVVGQQYGLRHLGYPVQYFDSFDAMVEYLRSYLPIYPVFAGGEGEARELAPEMP